MIVDSRLTWVLACVGALLTGYVVFFEPRQSTTDEARVLAGRVFDIRTDEVTRIHLRRDHWTQVVLERVDAHAFRIVEPVPGAADTARVEELLTHLELATPRATLPGDGVDEARRVELGLKPARIEVTLHLGLERQIEFAVGGDSPVGDGVYLSRAGSPDVVVVDRGLVRVLTAFLDRAEGTSSITEEGKPTAP